MHTLINSSVILTYFLKVNDSSMVIPLKNDSVEQIDAWVDRLRSSSGKKRQDKYRWQTLNPSTQGTWSPYVNKNAVN